jgi:hypothetical protein
VARTVVVMCDLHLENGQRVEAEELPPITMEEKGPRVLALCPEHKREYYDPFAELVEDLGLEPPDAQAGQGSAEPKPQGGGEAEEKSSDGEPTQDRSGDQDAEPSREDPDRVVAESPAMTVVSDEPETARWDCPVDDCDKTYSASGENRAEDLKRLGNLHLRTVHDLDKAARLQLLSA